MRNHYPFFSNGNGKPKTIKIGYYTKFIPLRVPTFDYQNMELYL